jgi:retron-type reverse transcriptase
LEGYKYAIDMAKFFDMVNYSKLIEILSCTVKYVRVISLIHKYLNAVVVVGHKFEKTEAGVPQGGPLSPLLCNIMLNFMGEAINLFVMLMTLFFCVKAREPESV